jgi:pimeloyl-ACP methyl ester carboxylesterase
VLEAGLGDNWRVWNQVAPEVARFARVVAYSRAGLPESEPGALPRTTRDSVEDLHALLGAAGIAPPYLLVGMSHGCLVVRLYAARYPDQVAGVVLMDGPHEELLPDHERWLAALPPEEGRRQAAWFYGGNASEHADLAESQRQLAGAALPRGAPVVYVASGWLCGRYPPPPSDPPPRRRDLEETRAAVARRYGPDTRLVVAEQSGHYIQLDQPELVVETIRAVAAARRRP